MNNTNNLVNLAKGGGKKVEVKVTKPAPKKPEVKVVEKPKTPEEERDIKAKQRVEELLNGVDLMPKKEEELLEVIEQPKEGLEWLEEQVSLLSEQNEALRAELGVAKADYSRLYESQRGGGGVNPNETLHQNVLIMFNELQINMLGHNQERTPWSTVNVIYLLNQMLSLFPFTEKYKKF